MHACRELEKVPQLLIAGLPSRPSEYALLPGQWLPKPRTRKLIGMLGVILAGIALIMVGYLSVGLTGYLAFPKHVSSNVLNSFGTDDTVMVVRAKPDSGDCIAACETACPVLQPHTAVMHVGRW